MEIKEIWKKIWHFIWHSDSVWSWLLNIVLAYFFILYIFYPGVGLIFNTSYPLVAVVSGSMEHAAVNHDGGSPFICDNSYSKTDLYLSFDEYWQMCGNWYENKGIQKEQFSEFDFKDGFNKGDIMFIYGTTPKNLKTGDIIVFIAGNRPDPIIHRIIDIDIKDGKYYYTTKGDHNQGSGLVDINISEDAVLGKAVFRVPYFGWIKVWFTDIVTWIMSARN
ncbi:signal peptidase I [Candidatus Woesearchaeota archaeon]|nr:signal peptidase I [Candidatus Woesearchaeota archaeon]